MTSKHAVAPTLQADALEKGFMSGDMQVPVLRGLSLMVCMVPSPGHQGAPHAALGMVRPFTVAAKSAQR